MRKRILAICGSTRAMSSNLQLIKIIGSLYRSDFDLILCDNLASLPHFNPDIDTPELVPGTVRFFREQIKLADGILICTPEYAHGVPGTLKNAIDWTVSQSGFSGRPVVLITAATDGKSAHNALLETLRVIEAPAIDELQLLISFVKAKINEQGITDSGTQEAVKKLIEIFKEKMNKQE